MTFNFAQPLILILLLLPILSTYLLWGRRASRPAGLRYGYTQLTTLPGRSWRLVLRPALPALRLLVLCLVIIAAARPQTGEAVEIVEGEGIDIAIALDISGSMESLDFEPQNRLETAKQLISEFIARRENDRIGLVVFAKDSFIQSPPTLDHDVLQFLVNEVQLASDLRIEEGTAIGLGLASAANMLRNSTAESKVVILVTDGVNTAGEIDAVTAATAIESLGMRVHTIGIGRTGLVPVPQRDLLGERIVLEESEFDEETLRQIAANASGHSFWATDLNGLEQIYQEIDSLEKSQVEVSTITNYRELAGWLLIPALAILLLELMLRSTFLRKIP